MSLLYCIVFCTWSKKYEPKAKSVWCNKGTPNLKLESVKEHENSTMHRKSVAAEKAARNPTTTPAAKTLQTLNRLQMERMTILFRSACAMGKKARPYSDYF